MKTTAAWMAGFGALGVALALLYPDSYQQDAANHFLHARWAWRHPELFVGVWDRPLWTLVYAFPALLGYTAAKLFTVALGLATAWQTVRLAEQAGIARAPLAVPLLLLQPTVMHLWSDTLTEPPFALLLVIALRLWVAARFVPSMLVVSTLILVRPEGLFFALLAAAGYLIDARVEKRRLPWVLVLGAGMAAWWLAALVITHDPLWIYNKWPPDWKTEGGRYGRGPIWTYVLMMPEIVGPLLMVPFVAGLVIALRRREQGPIIACFATLFVVHSIMRAFAIFNAAGYARYFVCVGPATALLALVGWNAAADRLPRAAHLAAGAAVLAFSAFASLFYVDAWGYGRDARAVAEMHAWWRANERPVARFLWSQAYMDVLVDRDPYENVAPAADRERSLVLLRESRRGTLVFWDGQTGPNWWKVTAADIESAGYVRLRSKSYVLEPRFFSFRVGGWGGTRTQEMHLLYRE